MKPSRDVQKKGALIADQEAMLVKHIRAAGGLSRIELSHALTLSPTTIGAYVDRLLHEGILIEGERAATGVGRPRTSIALNPVAGQFIGVDFYADEILAVAMDFAQNVVAQTRHPIRRTDTAHDVVNAIVRAIEEVLPAKLLRLLGIGIGSPGPVDRSKGTAREYRYIKGFQNVPLVSPIAERFDVPVYIENTANAMALAELWFGQGRSLNSFACLSVRSGIGAGIVVNRQLYSGLSDGAGEIGFWRCPVYRATSHGSLRPIQKSGPRELEEIASVRAIHDSLAHAIAAGRRSALGDRSRSLNAEHIVDAYLAHDRLTRSVINAAAGSLGWAIAHLSFCLAPEQVILAGPLASLGDDFLNSIAQVSRACFAATGLPPPSIAMSALGPYSGALGAAALVVDQWKPTR
ncbi:MAG: ROK family protein [Lentisphaerae bacterium]|nr:ROK family protein [Lentisphaerota bacterium]